MKTKNITTKEIIIAIALIIFYFFSSVFQLVILELLGIDYNNLGNLAKSIFGIITEFIILAIIIIPYRNELKTSLKNFIENKDEYFKKYFKYWLLMFAIMALSNTLILALKGTDTGTSVNEDIIRQQFMATPIYIYISAVIIAPIMEEIIFRRCLRSIFHTNKIVYIIMSALVFGFVHLLAGITSPIDLLYLIPYGTPGAIFAYLYVKSDNIMVPMSIHIMHNGIQMSIQALLLLLG